MNHAKRKSKRLHSGEIVCLNKVAVKKEVSFINSRYSPALTAYEYRGYIISAWARPESTNGVTSVGIVYERDECGKTMQAERIEGELFDTQERAEQHGIQLCKEWVDKRMMPEEFDRRVG